MLADTHRQQGFVGRDQLGMRQAVTQQIGAHRCQRRGMVDGDRGGFGAEPRRGFMLLFPMRTADPPQSHAILPHPPCPAPWPAACCLLPAACCLLPAACCLLLATFCLTHHPASTTGFKLLSLLQQLTQDLAIHGHRLGVQHTSHISLGRLLLSLTTQSIP